MSGVILNPIQTTNAQPSFYVSSDGLVQGAAFLQPNSRYNLEQGNVAAGNVLYGGCAVSVSIAPNTGLPGTKEPTLALAGSIAAVNGLVIFDQSVAMINTPQSTVPTASAAQSVSFVRIGQNTQVVVAAVPTLLDLDGGLITQQVSWDFTNQQLIPYVPAYGAATPTAYAYTSSTGALALTFAAAPGPIVGDVVTLTGFTGANVALNGAWPVTALSGDVLTVSAIAGLGALTPTGGTLVAGGGAFPCQILQVSSGNSMTISSAAGLYNWNYTGTAALISF